MAEKEKVSYTKPTSQQDLEARLENDNAVPGVQQPVNPGTPDETEDVYVGVDPIYQNHANDTERPIQATKGPDKDAEQSFLKDGYAKPEVNVKNRKAVEKGKSEDQETRRNTAYDDRVTEQSSPLFAKDPGAGEANAETNDGEDEQNPNGASASPTGSSATPPSTEQGKAKSSDKK